MKRFMLASMIASTLGIAGAASAAPAPGIVGDIEVMTQNQYLGADIAPLIAAISEPGGIQPRGCRGIGADRRRTRLRIASSALAGQILQRQPHLVGLQEVWEFSLLSGHDARHNPCEIPRIAGAFSNHLDADRDRSRQSTVCKLELGRFVHLPNCAAIPASRSHSTVFFNGVATRTVRCMDRDVILARADVSRKTPFAYPCDRPVSRVRGGLQLRRRAAAGSRLAAGNARIRGRGRRPSAERTIGSSTPTSRSRLIGPTSAGRAVQSQQADAADGTVLESAANACRPSVDPGRRHEFVTERCRSWTACRRRTCCFTASGPVRRMAGSAGQRGRPELLPARGPVQSRLAADPTHRLDSQPGDAARSEGREVDRRSRRRPPGAPGERPVAIGPRLGCGRVAILIES